MPSVTVGACFGSAFLAAGLVADVDIATWNPPDRVIRPDPEAHRFHEAGYRDFRDLYDATAAVVHRLARRAAPPR